MNSRAAKNWGVGWEKARWADSDGFIVRGLAADEHALRFASRLNCFY